MSEKLMRPRKPGALEHQIGGDHYIGMPIQPVTFIGANKLGFCEGSIVKYVARHKAKGGASDIRKAIHYCQLILQMQYGVDE